MLELFSQEGYLLRSDKGKYRCIGNTEHYEYNLFILPSSELCRVSYSVVVSRCLLCSSEAVGLFLYVIVFSRVLGECSTAGERALSEHNLPLGSVSSLFVFFSSEP